MHHADASLRVRAEFREYSRYPAPKELQHFLKYLAKNDRKPSIPASVYTGTLGLAGKSAFGAVEGYAKDKIKQVGLFLCSVGETYELTPFIRARRSLLAVPLAPSARESSWP